MILCKLIFIIIIIIIIIEISSIKFWWQEHILKNLMPIDNDLILNLIL